MSGAVRAAANEPGFLQICVSRWPALGVEEGVSSALSFSCGWSLSEAFPRENSLTLIKCELTPKPFPQSGYLPGFSPAYFHELFIALWRPPGPPRDLLPVQRFGGRSLDCTGDGCMC